MISKVCRVCRQEKALDDFHPHRSCAGERRPECKACFNAARTAYRNADIERHRTIQRRRYHANPEKHRRVGRESYQANREWRSLNYTISRYGLTLDQYHALQERQDFSCAICGDVTEMHIDHCHDTKRIRGLLCAGCNLGIGHFRERPEALVAAAAYVAGQGR